jgi:hypothetical protein
MVFSRRDVEASFPLSIKQDEGSAPNGNQARGGRLRKGRTKGTGFQRADAPLLEKMAEAIAADSSLNATSAAKLVADEAKGASYEAKVDRLARAFRAGRNGE